MKLSISQKLLTLVLKEDFYSFFVWLVFCLSLFIIFIAQIVIQFKLKDTSHDSRANIHLRWQENSSINTPLSILAMDKDGLLTPWYMVSLLQERIIFAISPPSAPYPYHFLCLYLFGIRI